MVTAYAEIVLLQRGNLGGVVRRRAPTGGPWSCVPTSRRFVCDGNYAGAWSAMLVGSGLAVAGLILPIYVDMPFNDNWMMLIAMLSGIAAFIVVSLATCRAPHDMQQIRGVSAAHLALAPEHVNQRVAQQRRKALPLPA